MDFGFLLPFKGAGAVVKHSSSKMCIPVMLLGLGQHHQVNFKSHIPEFQDKDNALAPAQDLALTEMI